MRRAGWLLGMSVLAGCAAAPSASVAPIEKAPSSPSNGARLAAPGFTDDVAPVASLRSPGAPVRYRRVSVSGAAKASSGPAALAADGQGDTEWNPRDAVAAGKPQWLALPLDGPAKGPLALDWNGHGMHYLYGEYGRPRTYSVEVSSDSTDGADGHWKAVAHVTDNQVRSRVSLFDAPGARWVRLSFETVWDDRFSTEPYLREATVYEAEGAGAPDVWAIFGDSVTSVGFDPAGPQTFSAEVAKRHPGHQPILVSGGTGGDESANAITRLDVALPTLPPGSVVGLCYGSNDAARGVSVADYKQRLQSAVDRLKAQGYQPIVAVVPWSLNGAIASYADACRELAAENHLPPGPDFYTYFKAHPDELRSDKVHPTDVGVATMQRMWAEAADFRYAP